MTVTNVSTVAHGSYNWRRALGPIAKHIGRHPSLWFVSIQQMFRAAPNRWWMRRPFLPLPDQDWLEFRIFTFAGYEAFDHNGEAAAHVTPTPKEMERFLRWCSRMEKIKRDRSRLGVS